MLPAIHSRIPFEVIKIKNRQWHHRVYLVETIRKIYNLILNGQDQIIYQGKNLTSGHGHVINKKGHIAISVDAS